MEKLNQRRVSLEEDFMNFKTNDLLYAFMRSLSTARPEVEEGKVVKTANGKDKYKEYLPIKTFKQNKKLIAGICGCSTRTIDNQLNKLFEAGLIDQGVEEVEIKGKAYDYECFWFPYNPEEKYKLVDKEVLGYLVNTRNAQGIRVYIYLLNKYQWKKDYVFTIKEIKEALGYAASTKTADKMIKDILASFNKEGIIKYEKIIEEVDVGGLNDTKIIPVERMKLKYVLENRADLPNF